MQNLKRILAVALLGAGLAPAAFAQSLPGGFVYLRDIDPTIIQDIRYATSNNFVGRPLAGYQAGECVVKREVGLRLKNIQQELAKQKLSLKMFDCYRPARAAMDMVKWSRNGKETAAERRYNPAFRKVDLFRLGYIAAYSGHSTGSALDLTLVDLNGVSRKARAGRQHGHGHRLRLFRREGKHRVSIDHGGTAQMAHHAGGCDAQARLCELFSGVVALFSARRGRRGL
jgi:D-alanyl-D-alanine dipeptidase